MTKYPSFLKKYASGIFGVNGMGLIQAKPGDAFYECTALPICAKKEVSYE